MNNSNLVITITNNTDKKIYTSFLAPGDSDKGAQQITTDSSTSSWQPPVLQAATNCKCDAGSYSCDPSKTQLTIPIKIDSAGGAKPWSTIYFSYSPGYLGGNDGTFDSIPVNFSWTTTQAQDPQYDLGATYTSCNSNATPYIEYIIIGILFVASIALIVISILLKNKLWIVGLSLLLISIILVIIVMKRGKRTARTPGLEKNFI